MQQVPAVARAFETDLVWRMRQDDSYHESNVTFTHVQHAWTTGNHDNHGIGARLKRNQH